MYVALEQFLCVGSAVVEVVCQATQLEAAKVTADKAIAWRNRNSSRHSLPYGARVAGTWETLPAVRSATSDRSLADDSVLDDAIVLELQPGVLPSASAPILFDNRTHARALRFRYGSDFKIVSSIWRHLPKTVGFQRYFVRRHARCAGGYSD